MLGLKVELKDAEYAKRFLSEGSLFCIGKIKRDKTHIIFPVIEEIRNRKGFPGELVIEEFDIAEERSAKDELISKLSIEEAKKLKTAYDLIGDIAILEIDSELKEKEEMIAQMILDSNKNIKTVVKKAGIHDGEFRTQPVVHVAGEKKTKALYKENGVRLLVDVGKVYFSPRLSTERKRIMQEVKPGEHILCMFSGAGPYPIVFSKNTMAERIVGIEINPEGHSLALENVMLNKVKNVFLYNGDVREIVPKIDEKFDRITMPLPKSAEDFLDTAIMASKKGTIIHFYDFLHKDRFFEAHEKIRKACELAGVSFRILGTFRCGQHAPYVYRICVDFAVE